MTTSPGSINVFATRSITCCPPVVTIMSSGSTPMFSAAITSAMQSLVPSSPSVGPYCSAFAHDSAAIRCATAANVSGGKVPVSGRPPAREITSGRAVTAMRSRIADDFMTFVREANSPAYRSRSREMLTRTGARVPSSGERLPRHHHGHGTRRRHRRAALPAAALGRRPGPGRRRHRLRRHGLALPRIDGVPAGRAGGGARRLPAGALGRRARRGDLQRGARDRAGRPAVRGRARRRRHGRLDRPDRRPHLRLARLAGRRRPGAGSGRARSTPGCGSCADTVAAKRKKVVLAVIDSLKPDMLDLAIEEGRAPALQALRDRGTYVRDCLSTFPSLTPVASAAIATGQGPGEHHIPSMDWYHRGEERYVEYGSSFQATRAFGVVRSLYDTVYNMNMAHLTRAHRTVFEHLDDAGLRTACTTYLIYRGRTRHDPSGASVYRRIAEAAQFRHPVYGARELFYADLFDSRNTGCTSALGMPGQRDRHTGCVGAYLAEHDLFDFLLFSLPDNDTHSHKAGPEGQVVSIAEADRALERIMHVAGGVEAFLEDHAVIVMSDHSQTKVEEGVNLADAFADARVLTPADPAPTEAELAVCPAARSAMVYVLDESRRGEQAVLHLEVGDGLVTSETYPDGLNRLWSALDCPHSGDVLVSAEPGFEFVDWGGADHVGGGSHGSLHADDSEGVLLVGGMEVPEREEWAVTDVAPLVLDHFDVPLRG